MIFPSNILKKLRFVTNLTPSPRELATKIFEFLKVFREKKRKIAVRVVKCNILTKQPPSQGPLSSSLEG